MSTRQVWEKHWHGMNRRFSMFGTVATLVRTQGFSRAVEQYLGPTLQPGGVFLEAGCGTSESSCRLHRGDHTLIGVDFSSRALRRAKAISVLDDFVQADIFQLPMRSGSIDGIWNLGVMEHFDGRDSHRILLEFHRVLRPGGRIVLFWPPTFGLSRWVLAPFEKTIGAWRRQRFQFFPDEVNRLGSKRAGRQAVAAAGFTPITVDFSLLACLCHLVVVASKPTP